MTTAVQHPVDTFIIEQEARVAAPADVTFAALLAQISTDNTKPGGEPFPMKLEPWPGGRWYRDLGDNAGHLWAHVQVIKPPTLLELCGPIFMSYPAISHVQYRLAPEPGGTLLRFTHRCMGTIEPDHAEGVRMGWAHGLRMVREAAERRARR